MFFFMVKSLCWQYTEETIFIRKVRNVAVLQKKKRENYGWALGIAWYISGFSANLLGTLFN